MDKASVYMVGLYHSLQLTVSSPDINDDKKTYLSILNERVQENVVVAEEIGEKENQSDAKKMALERGAEYHNIDIHEETKKGIRYIKMAVLDVEMENIDNRDNSYARSWNLVREWHMIETINTLLKERPGRRFLIIVGLSHVDAIRHHIPKCFDVNVSLFYVP